jgi:hypothetical protein
LERGLEGTLAVLRWQAIVGMEEEVMKPVFTGDGREVEFLQWCLPSFGFALYIEKEVEATAQPNQQTKRIILMCDCGELQQKPLNPRGISG